MMSASKFHAHPGIPNQMDGELNTCDKVCRFIAKQVGESFDRSIIIDADKVNVDGSALMQIVAKGINAIFEKVAECQNSRDANIIGRESLSDEVRRPKVFDEGVRPPSAEKLPR